MDRYSLFSPLRIHCRILYLISRNLFKLYSKCRISRFLQSLPKGPLHQSLHCTEYYTNNNDFFFLKTLPLSPFLPLTRRGSTYIQPKKAQGPGCFRQSSLLLPEQLYFIRCCDQ